MSRVLQTDDPRLLDPALPFFQKDINFIVHRHKIHVMRSMENAKEQSRSLKVLLYLVQAYDEAVRSEDREKLTAAVQADLLRRASPDHTKALPSFLPLYAGMRRIRMSKECVQFGVMKSCPCILRCTFLCR